MGHKVGYIACKKLDSSEMSGFDIDIERGESTPLIPKSYKKSSITLKQKCDSSFVLLSCILVIGTIIGFYLLLQQGQKLKFNVPFFLIERSFLVDNINSRIPETFFNSSSLASLQHATNIVFLNTHFPQCDTKKRCIEIIKSLVNLGVPVHHNFLIGGDGHVYEMLGWDHLDMSIEYDDKNLLTVGFMGDFTHEPPPSLMFDVAKALISESIRRRKLNTNYNVFGLRKEPNVMDGDAMYQRLAIWPHWNSVIDGKK
uniref:CSON007311 protein n=2 Tax=Culicoides sonorensis TaxID=179676 RepID=A0A336MVC2_CULSO